MKEHGHKNGHNETAASLPSRAENLRKIAELFAIHGPVIPDIGPSWNVAPQTFQPIVRLNRDKGEREIVLMRWWLIPYSYWAKDPTIGLRTINAKAGTITTAPAFREAIKYRLCPVPAGKARAPRPGDTTDLSCGLHPTCLRETGSFQPGSVLFEHASNTRT